MKKISTILLLLLVFALSSCRNTGPDGPLGIGGVSLSSGGAASEGAIKPGEKIDISFETYNLQPESGRVSMKIGLEIVGPQGEVVYSAPEALVRDGHMKPDKPVRTVISTTLNPLSVNGEYTATISVTDRRADKVATLEQKLTLKDGLDPDQVVPVEGFGVPRVGFRATKDGPLRRTFSPGTELVIDYTVAGLKLDKENKFGLKQTVTLIGPDGKELSGGAEVKLHQEFGGKPGDSLPMTIQYPIPATVANGECVLRMDLEDTVAGVKATREATFKLENFEGLDFQSPK